VLLRALLRASRQRQRRRRTSDQYTDYEIATLHSTTSPPLAPSGAERQQYAITFTQPSVRNLLKDRSRAGETMARYRVCLFNRFGSLFFANVLGRRREGNCSAGHLPLALAGIKAAWARWAELRRDARASRIAAWVWPAVRGRRHRAPDLHEA
jgi:hypothetical protein